MSHRLTGDSPHHAHPTPESTSDAAVMRNSATMAAGTLVSRLSGYGRAILLVAALGNGAHADLFTIANTVPNMLYILLAGGVFNAVLVPQLVRAQRHDADGGEAYTNRIVTLAVMFLAAVSLLLVLAAPAVMSLMLDSAYNTAEYAAQKDSIIDLARYCLPQVFFYGMFVLVGQILNARGQFGPMMWAPIANNVISISILLIYLGAFGQATGTEQLGPYTVSQEALLGAGSTLGIAVQLAVLVPYLRKAGFTFKPRFDFRGQGLGHTMRLGLWTVLFVVVNQIAYTVIVRLASGGTVGTAHGTGYTVYSSTFLIAMVPHSVITVSLATAILPRLAQRATTLDPSGFASALATGLRTALLVIVPFACVMPLVAEQVARVTFGHGAASDSWRNFVPSLALFGGAIVFFTVHYLTLRGFYAMEKNKPVFFIQCVVAFVNIVVATLIVGHTSDSFTAPGLVIAYGSSYLVGSMISVALLQSMMGGIVTRAMTTYVARIIAAALVSTAAAAVVRAILLGASRGDGFFWSLFTGAVIGLVDLAVFLAVAHRLRVHEVVTLTSMVRERAPAALRWSRTV